jgi:hypothetical protein
MNPVVGAPARNSGWRSTFSRKGMLVLMPRTCRGGLDGVGGGGGGVKGARGASGIRGEQGPRETTMGDAHAQAICQVQGQPSGYKESEISPVGRDTLDTTHMQLPHSSPTTPPGTPAVPHVEAPLPPLIHAPRHQPIPHAPSAPVP